MKCIRSYGSVKEVRRVSDEEALKKVRSKKWKYVPKSEWKQARDRIEVALEVPSAPILSIKQAA